MLFVLISACLTCGDTALVSGFWDIGDFRDTRNAYVKSAATLAHSLAKQHCHLHFFCGDGCFDFIAAFPPTVRIYSLPLHKAMQSIYLNHSAEETLLNTVNAMRLSAKSRGFMTSHNVAPTVRYVEVMDSKFVTLLRASRLSRSTNIAWIDSGLFRHPDSAAGFDTCRVKYQKVRGALAAVSDFGPWPPRLKTIFLDGPRRELAATVLLFNRTWYKNVFFARYKSLRLQLLEESLVTSDQGMLTLMAQQPNSYIKMQAPSYARIAARLLCLSE